MNRIPPGLQNGKSGRGITGVTANIVERRFARGAGDFFAVVILGLGGVFWVSRPTFRLASLALLAPRLDLVRVGAGSYSFI